MTRPIYHSIHPERVGGVALEVVFNSTGVQASTQRSKIALQSHPLSAHAWVGTVGSNGFYLPLT
jgi:hypothetical protein